jgi:hypothetical protein
MELALRVAATAARNAMKECQTHPKMIRRFVLGMNLGINLFFAIDIYI